MEHIMTLPKVHPLSIVLGLALALALSALTSFGQGNRGAVDKSMRISLDPEPESIVQIVEGDPYTIPGGRILMIKSVGDANGIGIGGATVSVNGVPVVSARTDDGSATLGFPVTARPGDVVTVNDTFGPDPNTMMVVGGYLARPSGH